MDQANSFREFLTTLKPGDMVTFSTTFSSFKLSGELRKIFWQEEECRVTLYSFMHREDKTYVLTEELKLSPLDSKKELPALESWNDDWGETPTRGLFQSKIARLISLVILAAILFPILSIIPWPLNEVNYAYEEFLAKDLSISQLYRTIRRRMTYQSEAGDYWLPPKDAWDLRVGDCEEFAVICSDYLNKHHQENYLVGLFDGDDFNGHAVVFVKERDHFTIIDLNRYSETFGIHKLTDSKTLEDALRNYTERPGAVYGIPTVPGEKRLIRQVVSNK